MPAGELSEVGGKLLVLGGSVGGIVDENRLVELAVSLLTAQAVEPSEERKLESEDSYAGVY
ncbi:MAG: hypothetical protein K2H83_07195 [Duncaniella sp.]|nr:hypothetical protein [Duncaniella sp.]